MKQRFYFERERMIDLDLEALWLCRRGGGMAFVQKIG